MATDDQSSNLLGNAGIVAIIAIAGAFFLHRDASLEGVRPDQFEIGQQLASRSVEARASQDPFVAISSRKNVDGRTNSNACREGGLRPTSDEETHAVAVLVPGGDYSEIAESRRRARYAILSSLAKQSFIGDTEGRISCLRSNSLDGDVPVETFTRANDHKRVAILWINEDDLCRASSRQPAPLAKLGRLSAELLESRESKSLTILGPYASETLVHMVREAGGSVPDLWLPKKWASPSFAALSGVPGEKVHGFAPLSVQDAGNDPGMARGAGWVAPRGLKFYSYGATIADAAISHEIPELTFRDVESFFSNKGIEFRRFITDDRVAAAGLRAELRARGIEAGPNKHHVVFLSEWDSIYGRTLPPTIVRAIDESCSDGGAVHRHEGCQWAHVFRYARGLDGLTPLKPTRDQVGNGRDSSAATSGRANDKPIEKLKAEQEASVRPFGVGQQDYLRRLAAHLKNEDEKFRSENRNSYISAIGVLGSDVFDKLLVMRALKPQFPEALFFTTDFDYAFSLPSELRWTRNLVIASGYGPELRDEFQGGAPPFRSAYQTAAFFALQAALAENSSDDESQRRVIDALATTRELKQARLFEIGRSGALIELPPFPNFQSKIHPDPSSQAGRKLLWISLAAGGMFASFLVVRISGLRSSLHPTLRADEFDGLKTEGLTVLALLLSIPFLAFAPLLGRAHGWSVTITFGVWVLLVLRVLLCSERCQRFRRSDPGDSYREPPSAETAIAVFVFIVMLSICIFWPEVASYASDSGRGEPIAFFEGVSLLPVVLIRFIVFFLALALLLRGLRRLRQNISEICQEMHLEHPKKILAALQNRQAELPIGKIPAFLKTVLPEMFATRTRLSCEGSSYNIEEKWRILVEQGRFSARCIRVASYTIIIFFIFGALAKVFGWPNSPHRSEIVDILYREITILDIFAMLALLLFVVDATYSFWLFVDQLGHRQSQWPKLTKEKYARLVNIPADDPLLDHWIDVDFIAKRTACIGSLIYYPFLLIAIIILSRSSVFSNFTLNYAIVITLGGSSLLLLLCALALQRSAESARDEAKRAFKDGISRAGENADYTARITDLMTRVEAMREGAFTPILQQPLIRAVILPVASAGFTAITEFGILWV